MRRLGLLGGLLLALTLGALSLHVPGARTIPVLETKNAFVAVLAVSAAVYLVAVALGAAAAGRASRRLACPADRRGVAPAGARVARRSCRPTSSAMSGTAGCRSPASTRIDTFPDDPALAPLRDDGDISAHQPRRVGADDLSASGPGDLRRRRLRLVQRHRHQGRDGGVRDPGGGLPAAPAGGRRTAARAGADLCLEPAAGLGFRRQRPCRCRGGRAGCRGLAAAGRRRDGWAGVALGLAIATKFLPAVVAPVLWRARAGWRTAAACIGTVIALYAAYSSVGWLVFGYLGSYGPEEGYDSGAGFWLLAGIVPLGRCYRTLRGRSTRAWLPLRWRRSGPGIAFVRRPNDPVALCAAAGVMMAVATCAISPHYPWYFAWLAVPCVLAPTPAVVWLSAAPDR